MSACAHYKSDHAVGVFLLVTGAMSVSVCVSLLSGRTVALQAKPRELVKTLKKREQAALEVGSSRLLGPSGSLLDDASTVKKARLQEGDALALHMLRVQIATSGFEPFGAFAAMLGDGSVDMGQ